MGIGYTEKESKICSSFETRITIKSVEFWVNVKL